MNYTGDRRSILTLAHELGHGLHGVLAQPLGYFNSSTPLTTAETRSVFGEALTFERLLAAEDDPRGGSTCSRADRGRDRDDVPADRDEPLRDAVHTSGASRASSLPSGSASCGSSPRTSSSPTHRLDSPAMRRGGAHIPHFTGQPRLRSTPMRTATLFSLAHLPRYVQEGDAMVDAVPRACSGPGGSRSPEEAGRNRRLDLNGPGPLGEQGSTRSRRSSTRPSGSAGEIGLGCTSTAALPRRLSGWQTCCGRVTLARIGSSPSA
jgi:oligoendopeptidase F